LTSNEKVVTNLVDTLLGAGRASKMTIFAGEDIANKKQAPDIYNLAVNTLALEKLRCLIAEDSRTGTASTANASYTANTSATADTADDATTAAILAAATTTTTHNHPFNWDRLDVHIQRSAQRLQGADTAHRHDDASANHADVGPSLLLPTAASFETLTAAAVFNAHTDTAYRRDVASANGSATSDQHRV